MTIKILLFGITKDLIGKQSLMFDLKGPTTVSEFKNLLFKKFPELVSMDSIAVAVNSEYALENDFIKANDEIALIPPVSGG